MKKDEIFQNTIKDDTNAIISANGNHHSCCSRTNKGDNRGLDRRLENNKGSSNNDDTATKSKSSSDGEIIKQREREREYYK